MYRIWIAGLAALGASAAWAQAPAPKVLYQMEELRTVGLPPAVIQEIAPLHTLADIEAVLKAHHVPFAWVVDQVRSANLPPAMVTQIDKLPRGEPMVIPMGKLTVIAVVVARAPDPGGSAAPPAASTPPLGPVT